MDFGLQATLPDSAQLVANIQDPGSSSATGFDRGSLTPLFDITKESASLTLAAFSTPELKFGIEFIEIGKVDVGLTVKLPEVSVTLTAAYGKSRLGPLRVSPLMRSRRRSWSVLTKYWSFTNRGSAYQRS